MDSTLACFATASGGVTWQPEIKTAAKISAQVAR
jgi:hypothetical protein